MVKIIDCITFYDENLITNSRFEILKDVVDKFIVCGQTTIIVAMKKKLTLNY